MKSETEDVALQYNDGARHPRGQARTLRRRASPESLPRPRPRAGGGSPGADPRRSGPTRTERIFRRRATRRGDSPGPRRLRYKRPACALAASASAPATITTVPLASVARRRARAGAPATARRQPLGWAAPRVAREGGEGYLSSARGPVRAARARTCCPPPPLHTHTLDAARPPPARRRPSAHRLRIRFNAVAPAELGRRRGRRVSSCRTRTEYTIGNGKRDRRAGDGGRGAGRGRAPNAD